MSLLFFFFFSPFFFSFPLPAKEEEGKLPRTPRPVLRRGRRFFPPFFFSPSPLPREGKKVERGDNGRHTSQVAVGEALPPLFSFLFRCGRRGSNSRLSTQQTIMLPSPFFSSPFLLLSEISDVLLGLSFSKVIVMMLRLGRVSASFFLFFFFFSPLSALGQVKKRVEFGSTFLFPFPLSPALKRGGEGKRVRFLPPFFFPLLPGALEKRRGVVLRGGPASFFCFFFGFYISLSPPSLRPAFFRDRGYEAVSPEEGPVSFLSSPLFPPFSPPFFLPRLSTR